VNTENKTRYAMRTKKKLGQFYSNGKVHKNETQFDSVFEENVLSHIQKESVKLKKKYR
jgi:hypothetical protein